MATTRSSSVDVEVDLALTEVQFRQVVETILGLPRERFKGWGTDPFHFTTPRGEVQRRLEAYLQTIPAAYTVTEERTWTP